MIVNFLPKKNPFYLFLLILMIAGVTKAFAQQQPLADRLTDRLKSEEFNVGILLQPKVVFSLDDDNFNGGRKFDLGATRLDVRGLVDGNFMYRFQVDFRRQTSIMDAQVGYIASENFRVIAGAFKPYTSRDLDPSPGNTDFINRARQVGAMMNSREIGVTILGEPNGFNYRFGLYNGTGLSRSNDNRFMYTARLGHRSQFDNGRLDIGLNAALNQTQGERVGNTGLVSEGDRTLYGAFFDYRGAAFIATFEFLQTRFNAQNFGGNEETITGFYGTLGANVGEKDQVLVRVDHLEFDLRGETSDLFTLGWNHQATRLISFQVNLLAQFYNEADTQYGLSGQWQFQF